MAIFVVIATGDPSPLQEAVERLFPGYTEIAPNAWLVNANAVVAKEVSDQLGLVDGGNGMGVVLTVSGYYGYASNAIWEWLAATKHRVRGLAG